MHQPVKWGRKCWLQYTHTCSPNAVTSSVGCLSVIVEVMCNWEMPGSWSWRVLFNYKMHPRGVPPLPVVGPYLMTGIMSGHKERRVIDAHASSKRLGYRCPCPIQSRHYHRYLWPLPGLSLFISITSASPTITFIQPDYQPRSSSRRGLALDSQYMLLSLRC